jgi:hypothetical protein
MMEELIEKMERLEELVINTICDSQSICNYYCETCDVRKDINEIKEEFEDLKQLLELSNM